MMHKQASIRFNHQIGPDLFHLGLACQGDFQKVAPGQFVMVRIGRQSPPLLRRPFSISGQMGEKNHIEGIELLIKVIGPGTAAFAHMVKEQTVDLLGPLGQGFRMDATNRKIYLVAGGIGVAPLRFLALKLVAAGINPKQIHLFFGGRSQSDLICWEFFNSLRIPVTMTTDDGSLGDQCLITDPLEVAVVKDKPDIIYACGPHGMLNCVAGIAQRQKVRCQVSIETMMACGMGVCLGCAVVSRKQQDHYLHACIHGPVFDVEELKMD